jgi:predicted permease
MRLIELWHRVTASIRRRRLDKDLEEEVAFHLAMRQASYTAGGAFPNDARLEARRRFGNPVVLRERMRDMWTFPSLESVRLDIHYALRSLRKSPGFAAVAIVALAIGIGGNTAIFSLVDAMRAQALPYKDAGQLVELIGNVQRAKVERRGDSYPDYLDWRAQAKSFVDIAAFDPQQQTLGNADDPERINTEFVSAPYFSLLGVSPALGRVFQVAEDDASKPTPVAILSDGLWRRHFGADVQIVGRPIVLNTRTFTIVGVMPPRFEGLSDRAEAWIPFALYAPPTAMAERGSRGFNALARLRPGVSIMAATSELDAISRQLERAYPATNEGRAVEVSPLDVELLGAFRPALITLMAAVALVLLIACANVGNLLIARSETRRRELAVRTALGAGRGRLLRQLITESCVLTVWGAVAGLLLARASVAALIAWSPVPFPSFITPGLDLRVAAFTVGVSLACGILVGLAPGLQAPSTDLSDSLKESAKGSGGRRSHRVRNSLVIAEVALAVVLLVGAGLMIRSVRNLAALHPGFDGESLLTLHISVPRAPVSPTASPDPTVAPGPPPIVSGRVLLDRIRTVPGVEAAGLGNDLPLDGGAGATFYTVEGQPAVNAQNMPRTYLHRVSPDFFHTLRIPLIAGRAFNETEAARLSSAVIVGEGVVKRFWPGQDPIGKRLRLGRPASTDPWLEIVGVVRDVKYRGLPENPTADPDMYLPFLDRNQQVAIVVRTNVPPAALAGPIRAAIREASASIPIYNVAPMDELIGRQTSRSRFTMWLMGVFAGIALLLSAVGIYGVMSYLVTQRTREIGIRLALGARTGEILRLILGNGARLIAVGLAVGIVASLASQRFIATLLFGVGSTDASAGIAVGVLAVVALLACLMPALRATRVDPLHALRQE